MSRPVHTVMTRIPKHLHFCFGLAPDFGGKPWSLVHHVCVASAIRHIAPTQAIMHCEYEPSGPWWQLTRPLLTVERRPAPREIFGRPLLHVAHRADALRVQTLLQRGGIYLDCDVLVHRSFDDLLENSVVMGQEGRAGEVAGLCNAVILAEPGAAFLERWLERFRDFRSRGVDEFWHEMAVLVPLQLQQVHPEEVTVLPRDAFFEPFCEPDDIRRLYGPGGGPEVASRYANHLWESMAWWHHLRDLTPGRVRQIDSAFHHWVRPYVADLPDDFGAPTLAEKVVRKLRHLRRVASKTLAAAARG